VKILSAGAEWLHADGQTDMTKLIVDFRNFAKVLKKKAEIRKLKVSLKVVKLYIA
jgi:hypothetical protein